MLSSSQLQGQLPVACALLWGQGLKDSLASMVVHYCLLMQHLRNHGPPCRHPIHAHPSFPCFLLPPFCLDLHSSKYPAESHYSLLLLLLPFVLLLHFPIFPTLFLEATVCQALKRGQNQDKATSCPCETYHHRETRGQMGSCTQGPLIALGDNQVDGEALTTSDQFCPQDNSGCLGKEEVHSQVGSGCEGRVTTQVNKPFTVFSPSSPAVRFSRSLHAGPCNPTASRTAPRDSIPSAALIFVRMGFSSPP